MQCSLEKIEKQNSSKRSYYCCFLIQTSIVCILLEYHVQRFEFGTIHDMRSEYIQHVILTIGTIWGLNWFWAVWKLESTVRETDLPFDTLIILSPVQFNGMIIGDEWIATAAHCLEEYYWELRIESRQPNQTIFYDEKNGFFLIIIFVLYMKYCYRWTKYRSCCYNVCCSCDLFRKTDGCYTRIKRDRFRTEFRKLWNAVEIAKLWKWIITFIGMSLCFFAFYSNVKVDIELNLYGAISSSYPTCT